MNNKPISVVPLKVLVIEDESIIAEMVKVMLEDFGHQVIGVAHNLSKAEEYISNGKFNFAVLDINLEGGMEGIKLGEQIAARDIPYIFLTSYADKQTVQEAKLSRPGAYVIKPFNEEDLFSAVEISTMHSQQQVKSDDQKINIKDGYKTQMVNLDDILYLKADNIHVEYHTKQRVVLSRQSLIKSIENLPSDRFIRIHKSYAINKSFITSYGAKFVRLGPISYSYKDSFRAAISS